MFKFKLCKILAEYANYMYPETNHDIEYTVEEINKNEYKISWIENNKIKDIIYSKEEVKEKIINGNWIVVESNQ